MTDLKQAAQAVVDRWDTPAWEWSEKGPTADLIAALRKALQQAEPVAWTLDSAPLGTKAPAFGGGAWMKTEGGWQWNGGSTFPRPGGDWDGRLILPTPPQRKPLTNEEITKAFNEAMAKRPKDASNAETNRLFVRAIEAAHRIGENK